MSRRTLIVTGGAGFIGSALIRHLIDSTSYFIVNVDKLTYAGNLESLDSLSSNPRYVLEKTDITDGKMLQEIFKKYQPVGVFHLAAESHVDRSIDSPDDFIQTNIVGTYRLLEIALQYYRSLSTPENFKFIHVSTDEVFGSLGAGGFFNEKSAYDPRSPYSASKAASDHLARAWCHTFGLPVTVTNCSNNFGPYQFPEKLIPVVILNALDGKTIPIYGKGENVRDWLFVEDHVKALHLAYEKGSVGETYLIGGHNEKTNLSLVQLICHILDEMQPQQNGTSYSAQIRFVDDRPGHDFRYAIDPQKTEMKLGWKPRDSFESALRTTVKWYIDNRSWCDRISSGQYRERLGLVRNKVQAL